MDKIYTLIRRITLAPVLASFSLIMMAILRTDIFTSPLHFIYMLSFLGILPLFAYPLQKYTPHFKDKGRDGQRTLAMIFAVSGYFCCLFCNLIFGASEGMWIICLEYLISGGLILVFNKLLHVKVSAHGCGSAGPIFLLLYFGLFVPAAVMGIVTILAYVASVKAKHHTFPQLVGGSAISICTLFAIAFLL